MSHTEATQAGLSLQRFSYKCRPRRMHREALRGCPARLARQFRPSPVPPQIAPTIPHRRLFATPRLLKVQGELSPLFDYVLVKSKAPFGDGERSLVRFLGSFTVCLYVCSLSRRGDRDQHEVRIAAADLLGQSYKRGGRFVGVLLVCCAITTGTPGFWGKEKPSEGEVVAIGPGAIKDGIGFQHQSGRFGFCCMAARNTYLT